MISRRQRAMWIAGCLTGMGTASGVHAEADPVGVEPPPSVVIIAPVAEGLELDKVPGNVQRATAEQIARSQSLDLTDFLNREFSSVSINHAQNNPLQPDVNFRGFTASPLLGLSPGLTVYQNGVRINEPFGDTINWDLIPLSAVSSVQLLAGSHPVFGLNSLGGALSLQMKTGFTQNGSDAQVYAGSFGRRGATVQSGGNNGAWGYYANVDYFEEDGWRDFSDSDALRFYTALSWRANGSTLDLSVAHADTKLRGNGASPVELLNDSRSAVFTHPDITENKLTQLLLEGARNVTETFRVAGNVFYRDLDTRTFNGDGSIFEECEFDDDEFLVEDFDDENGDGECNEDDDDDIEVVLDANGEPIEAEIDDIELNAINNIGRRKQKAYGASGQLSFDNPLAGHDNDLILGAYFGRGDTDFESTVEVASLLEDRSTSRTDIFAPGFFTAVGSKVDTSSVYFADTFSATDRTAVTISGRYDNTHIRLNDQSGVNPELDGRHRFDRFNPSAGVTFRVNPDLTAYASYAESARAPTPVELECASEDAPCSLPNAFLADPPLEQVVARSFELGLRGRLGGGLHWHAGAFRTVNDDDILFQTTGGAQANVGFFDNVGDTQRQGLELTLGQQAGPLTWSVEYSFIDATFEDAFVVNSPNHPVFDDDPDSEAIVSGEKLAVASGASIPGIPKHEGNIGADYAINDRLSLGADLTVRSGVYLRGDEANLMDKTDGYSILNLRATYRLSDRIGMFARIENALDEDYETFGLLGEPDEVFPGFTDPRFYGAGPPFGIWVGLKASL
jgi:iron complex outermembrane recepter protein